MKQGRRLTKKQKIAKAEKICDLYATGEVTLASACKRYKVSSDNTFYKWRAEITEVAELYKNAQARADEVYNERVKKKAKTALEMRLEGYFVDEVETTEKQSPNGRTEYKVTKTKRRYIPPSDTLTQVALYNRDPEDWKDKRSIEHSGPKGGPIEHTEKPDISKLTDEQLEAYEAMLEQAGGKAGKGKA